MCWVSVKEEDDYSVPSRPVKASRRREYSPRRPVRVEYIDERQPSPRVSAAYVVSAPPAPSYNPIIIAPEPAPSVSHHSRAPTVVAEGVHGSAAKSVHSGTVKSVKEDNRTQMVEVEEETSASDSESSATGTRSKSGKSRYSHSHAPSRHSEAKSKASRAASNAPKSEYDIIDREYRRERAFASPERGQYDTYRYIEAPPPPPDRSRDRRSSAPRSSYGDDPRASATSYRRERERIVIQDEDGRSHREYRR